MNRFSLARPGRRPGKGLSIIELMIGMTIGLFILAGATLVASTQLADNRKMLLETQIQQDLRATVDMISRDLRRAGYWAAARNNVWPSDGMVALSNPYTTISTTASSIIYDRSQDELGADVGVDNNTVDPDERVGFRLNQASKTVEMLVGANNWQALTDPNVVEVTQFNITLNSQSVPAPCGESCPTGPGGCPLVLKVRDATVVLEARAVHDNAIRRSVRSDVRLRNDVLAEACP